MYTSTGSTTAPFTIGTDPVGKRGFTGGIGQVKVYDRALTPQEIADLSETELPAAELEADLVPADPNAGPPAGEEQTEPLPEEPSAPPADEGGPLPEAPMLPPETDLVPEEEGLEPKVEPGDDGQEAVPNEMPSSDDLPDKPETALLPIIGE